MPFRKMRFKDAVVLARCDARGEPIAQDGRVEIRYRPGDSRVYHAALRNLQPTSDVELLPDDACPPGEDAPVRDKGARGTRGGRTRAGGDGANTASTKLPQNAVIVYADGACSGNPGPAGVGVVMIDSGVRRELSEYLGEGTNNIAELTALALAAEAVADPARPVRMHTDSQYSIGVLTKGWKAKANVALIAKVRAALARLQDVQLIHVRGHSGIALNERADALAVQAVQERRSSGWIEYQPRPRPSSTP